MDPNHWNTYNFQYGAAQGGLTPTHPSLGLSLSHGLQGAHSSISGRSMSALPPVNYTGLSMPLLETMTPLSSSMQPQQAHHKSMSIGEPGQIVFDPQVRMSAEQLSPSSINRYDAGNKMLRTEGLSRNQLLEAARVWGGTNFPGSSSLYNQYSAILPDVASMAVSGATSIPSSPGPGSYSSSSKSIQQQQQLLQEPPPAHSSSVPRITSCQRIQNAMGDLIYTRPSSESLNPSSLSLAYSSSLSKDSGHGSSSSSQQHQTTVHHRQTPVPPTQAFMSPHPRESESLSSAAAAQHQLYGSYSNLSVVDSHDFASQQHHLSGGDMTYEAVSPAAPPVHQPPQQETTASSHIENPSFSVAQFPGFANLGAEQVQAMVDKFQDSDYHLKLDPIRGVVPQGNNQDSSAGLSFHHSSSSGSSSRQHHQQQHTSKSSSKDSSSSTSSLMQSLQMNQPPHSHHQQSSSAAAAAFSHLQSPTANLSHASSSASIAAAAALTLTSLQQQLTQPTVQAPADSTTKPKRVRNRKKKGETPPSATSVASTPTPTNASSKKSLPQTSSSAAAVQRHPQHQHNLSNMPQMSPQMSGMALPHSPLVRDGGHQQHHHQQQQVFSPSVNQFASRDAQSRAQTPSMPQNYSMNDPQAFAHSPSPKIQSTNPAMLMSQDYTNMSRVTNEKPNAAYNNNNTSNTTTSAPPKRQRKQKQPSHATNVNNNNNSNNSSSNNQNNGSLYMSSIPTNNSTSTNQMSLQQQQQAYSANPNAMMNLSSHTDSPVRTSSNTNNNGSSGNGGHQGGGGSSNSATAQASRMGNYPGMPGGQTNLDTSPSVSNLNHQQPSPQDNKLHTSSHYLTNPSIMNLQQQAIVSDGRQHHSQSPSLNPQQQVVMSQTRAAATGYDANRGSTLIMDGNDPTNQFQVDFGGQPFFEQLVSAQNPNFAQTTNENGEEVILTTLVAPGEQPPQQEQQQQQQAGGDGSTAFRPTYHGAAVHEIHAVAAFDDGMQHVGGEMGYDGQTGGAYAGMNPNQCYSDYGKVEVEPMTLTFMPSLDEDDEFNHFGKQDDAVMTAVVKQEPGLPSHGSKKDNFQDSFLSYLQGNKQETLSSVSSAAITKKPQLPKYIPEPRRPRPPPPPPEVTVVHKEFSAPSTSVVDDSDDIAFVSAQGKDFLSTLSDNENSSQKSENSDKEGYTVQRTSELAMKITLPKGKKKGKISTLGESALLSHNKKQMKDEKAKVKRKRGKLVDSDGEEYMADPQDRFAPVAVEKEPSPPLVRTSIGRKAKDRVIEKKKKRKYADSGSSSEDEIFVRKTGLDSEKDYDSDKDPVWCPFDTDLKVGYDLVEKKKKPKRLKPLRTPMLTPVQQYPMSKPSVRDSIVVATTPQKTNSTPSTSKVSPPSATVNQGTYPLGQYLIEKKDMQNYENYPIWRLEPSNMIHKYELVVQEGLVRHKAVGTYSTWMKSMYDQFEAIKVKELIVKGKSESVLVQVLDDYQPKVPTDGKLIQQYEDDPLVESFNIYLQVFISQALEPTFLKAILDMGESFYLDPLNDIDSLVEGKVEELAAIAKWKTNFRDVLHRCPLMKEIDRPNLKQACQACENSSPPTIKSVLLSGQAYDKTLLTIIQGSGSDTAQEFMIGKVAAFYVRPYHSLYHFKYWLRSRCEAKVKVMMESDKTLTGENILDKCLENRTWVLQLFDNFKKLLAFNGESAR